jgi:hypothetical protein
LVLKLGNQNFSVFNFQSPNQLVIEKFWLSNHVIEICLSLPGNGFWLPFGKTFQSSPEKI